MTRLWLILALAAAPGVTQAAATGDSAATVSFQSFVDELWPQVQSRGVSRATFDSTFAGVTPDPRVLAATRRQPEYAKPFGTYINAFVSQERIAAGRRNAQRWNDTLAAVETTYGVDRSIILSIWGAESDYGAEKPRWNVIRSLATLAQAHYRDDVFRDELLAALQILQEGHISRDLMAGSWAGAMGQCQFLPSSFLQWAVDFSGDGQRDIWTNVPDVLASSHGGANDRGHLRHPRQQVLEPRPPALQAAANRAGGPPARTSATESAASVSTLGCGSRRTMWPESGHQPTTRLGAGS